MHNGIVTQVQYVILNLYLIVYARSLTLYSILLHTQFYKLVHQDKNNQEDEDA